MMRTLLYVALALLALVLDPPDVRAAEIIPPKPPRHFNDLAGVTSVEVQQQLDRALDQFEKSDSTQIVVAIYPKMQSDGDIAEYTVRVAQKWRAGTEANDNGAVLFVFVEDRKMYLQVGYGLEGAIPDITAKDITENRIKPHLRAGDYNAGMIAGVDSIIQSARGEYQGTGRTAANQRRDKPSILFFIPLIIFAIIGFTRRKRGHLYGGRGRRGWGGPIIWAGSGSGWGGGHGRGGGGGGGWGGGFSGGGGSFGGGGAGSSW
jgi:uncharacterized protein